MKSDGGCQPCPTVILLPCDSEIDTTAGKVFSDVKTTLSLKQALEKAFDAIGVNSYPLNMKQFDKSDSLHDLCIDPLSPWFREQVFVDGLHDIIRLLTGKRLPCSQTNVLRETQSLRLCDMKIRKLDGSLKRYPIKNLSLCVNNIKILNLDLFPKELEFLECYGNEITACQTSDTSLEGLRHLGVGFNLLEDSNITFLASPSCRNILSLDLSYNRLENLQNLIETLQKMTKLKVLRLLGNYFSVVMDYRQYIVFHLPKLKTLDDIAVTETDLIHDVKRPFDMTSCGMRIRIHKIVGLDPNSVMQDIDPKRCPNVELTYSVVVPLGEGFCTKSLTGPPNSARKMKSRSPAPTAPATQTFIQTSQVPYSNIINIDEIFEVRCDRPRLLTDSMRRGLCVRIVCEIRCLGEVVAKKSKKGTSKSVVKDTRSDEEGVVFDQCKVVADFRIPAGLLLQQQKLSFSWNSNRNVKFAVVEDKMDSILDSFPKPVKNKKMKPSKGACATANIVDILPGGLTCLITAEIMRTELKIEVPGSSSK